MGCSPGEDLLDVERMLAVRGAAFNRAFVRDALLEMLGEDERLSTRDAIRARVPIEHDGPRRGAREE